MRGGKELLWLAAGALAGEAHDVPVKDLGEICLVEVAGVDGQLVGFGFILAGEAHRAPSRVHALAGPEAEPELVGNFAVA